MEFSPQGTNKGSGLKALCQHLGLSLKQSIAVGDSDNDIEILKTATQAVAMGNANDKVKAVCDVIVSDCDHDGVAETIEEYLI